MTKAEATELRNFWCAIGELRQAVEDGVAQDLIDYHLDELEVIEMHTSNDALRKRCAEARRRYGDAGALHIA